MFCLRHLFFKALRYSGLPLVFRHLFQKKSITILLFHELLPENARNIFSQLGKVYHFISLKDFLDARVKGSKLPEYALIITFDDGHISNYALLPIFRELKVPAAIFVCAGLIDTKRHFWFKYHRVLECKESLKQVSNQERLYYLSENGFSPDREYDNPHALNRSHIRDMQDVVDFQAHSLFHPCLTTCSDEEAWREIDYSKKILEDEFGLQIRSFAYPNGDYAAREARFCQMAGYECALTEDAGLNTLRSDPFRLKRLSANDTNDPDELIVRASGLWGFLKHVYLKMTK